MQERLKMQDPIRKCKPVLGRKNLIRPGSKQCGYYARKVEDARAN